MKVVSGFPAKIIGRIFIPGGFITVLSQQRLWEDGTMDTIYYGNEFLPGERGESHIYGHTCPSVDMVGTGESNATDS